MTLASVQALPQSIIAYDAYSKLTRTYSVWDRFSNGLVSYEFQTYSYDTAYLKSQIILIMYFSVKVTLCK